jgi:calcineurin-like phosphoesterase family protein
MKYFIADTHFGQENINKFPSRSTYDSKSWDKMIIDKINAAYVPGAFLYILGDFAAKKKDVSSYRQKIKFKNVTLILGNHDYSKSFCYKIFRESRVFDTREVKINDVPCFLSHYPHLAWPKSHYGSFHLYGHMHDQRSTYWENIFPEIRSLDVSPESYRRHFGDFGIWSESQIFDILSKRSGHDDVSWYRSNK